MNRRMTLPNIGVGWSWWTEDEILVWLQVTYRLAASPSFERSVDVVWKRWQDAKLHIPEDKRGRVKGMLEGTFNVSLSL